MTTSDLARDHTRDDAHSMTVSGTNRERDQITGDAHLTPVALTDFDGDHSHGDTHRPPVAVDEREGGVGHGGSDAQEACADPADALLLVLADALDDIERTRIANQNRLRSLTTVKGLDETEASMRLGLIVLDLERIERDATKALERAMAAHSLGPWVKRTRGVGLKQAARLLAAIGDPVWNGAEDRPRRGPAELWQFCGVGDPARSRRRKGEKVEFNPEAKMRAHLVAESCIKQRESPYRPVYDRARASWADRDTTDLHKHNHALRCVAKAVLKDLFIEARRTER